MSLTGKLDPLTCLFTKLFIISFQPMGFVSHAPLLRPGGNLLWAATAGLAEEEHDCHTFETITLATVLRTDDRGEALTQENSQYGTICD